MRFVFLALAFASFLGLGAEAQSPGKSCPVAGRYSVAGLLTGSTREYHGEAVITDTGSACNVRWLPPNDSEGTGAYADNVLTVHYTLGGQRGVVRYERDSNGDLAGVFWPEGSPTNIQGRERLSPLNGKSTASASAGGASSPATSYRSPEKGLDGLLDQIVELDSHGWQFLGYRPGTMTGSRVIEGTQTGKTGTITGNYTFSGFGGLQQGWVKVRFVDGKVSCLEYWDISPNCRPLGGSSFGILASQVMAAAVISELSGGYGSGGSSEGLSRQQQQDIMDRAHNEYYNVSRCNGTC